MQYPHAPSLDLKYQFWYGPGANWVADFGVVPADARDELAARRRAAVGDEIRRLRIGHGWTQEDLADRAGIDRKSVNRVENGAYSPSLDRVFLIADALGAAVSALVAGADGPQN